MRTRFDVVPEGDTWQLRRDDAVVSNHDRQEDAVSAGRTAAHKAQPSQLFVHGADGKYKNEATYEDDPYPPKG